MKLPTRYFRAMLSLALALTVTTVFTLRSFASVETGKRAANSVFAQDCTGTLTVKDGSVTVNGNAAQTGATVTNGSVIATASNGRAEIDFGGAGRVMIGRGTAVTIDCAGGTLSIRSNCSGKTEIEVKSGSVNVTAPSVDTLAAGKEGRYDGPTAFTVAAGSVLEVDCEGSRRAAGAFIGPGLIGLLALIGLGTAVAVGIAVGEGDTGTSGNPDISGS
jgi:ferric-dicitrate binding protein FerR (iron transport regulator)